MTSHLVPHEPSSASAVRRELVTDLTSSEVPPAVVDDAALVMTELVGNAVRHGSPLPDGCVCVSWELADCTLHLEVRDGGSPYEAPVDSGVVPVTAESGRGLTIVSLLAERWGTMPDVGEGTGVFADLDLDVPRS